MINPVILGAEGDQAYEEGCLSVPGIYETVSHRAEQVTVRYQGLDGTTYELVASGLLAVCVQHEIEHLDGKVFVEHLSTPSRAGSRPSSPNAIDTRF